MGGKWVVLFLSASWWCAEEICLDELLCQLSDCNAAVATCLCCFVDDLTAMVVHYIYSVTLTGKGGCKGADFHSAKHDIWSPEKGIWRRRFGIVIYRTEHQRRLISTKRNARRLIFRCSRERSAYIVAHTLWWGVIPNTTWWPITGAWNGVNI